MQWCIQLTRAWSLHLKFRWQITAKHHMPITHWSWSWLPMLPRHSVETHCLSQCQWTLNRCHLSSLSHCRLICGLKEWNWYKMTSALKRKKAHMWGIIDQSFPTILLYEQKTHHHNCYHHWQWNFYGHGRIPAEKAAFSWCCGTLISLCLACTHLKLAGPLLFLSHGGQGLTPSPPPCSQRQGLSSSAWLWTNTFSACMAASTLLRTSFSHAPPLQHISVKPDPSWWTCRRNWQEKQAGIHVADCHLCHGLTI